MQEESPTNTLSRYCSSISSRTRSECSSGWLEISPLKCTLRQTPHIWIVAIECFPRLHRLESATKEYRAIIFAIFYTEFHEKIIKNVFDLLDEIRP